MDTRTRSTLLRLLPCYMLPKSQVPFKLDLNLYTLLMDFIKKMSH